MEEVWGHLGMPGSVHTAYFPEPADLTEGIGQPQREHAANWNKLVAIRDVVLKSLETARQGKFIGSSLEARVQLGANPEFYPLLLEYASELPGLFIVSQVELSETQIEPVAVKIEKALGEKCDRCWKYTQDHGQDPDFPTACAACAAAVRETLSYE